MKKCCTCKIEKAYEDFGKHRQWEDGYRPQCKECRNSRLRTGKKPGPPLGNIPWNKEKFTSEKRKSRRHIDWSKKVRERDGYLCTECGKKENLLAHHIIPWKENETLRFDISNGKTLCSRCHCIIEPKFPKNPTPWNKGLKNIYSKETKMKISECLKGRRCSPKTEFKKGLIPWNKGLKKEA